MLALPIFSQAARLCSPPKTCQTNRLTSNDSFSPSNVILNIRVDPPITCCRHWQFSVTSGTRIKWLPQSQLQSENSAALTCLGKRPRHIAHGGSGDCNETVRLNTLVPHHTSSRGNITARCSNIRGRAEPMHTHHHSDSICHTSLLYPSACLRVAPAVCTVACALSH